MTSRYKLPIKFDPKALKADLEHVDHWVAHFNTGYFEGRWTGIALRSPSGLASQLHTDSQATGPFLDTPILGRCPNVRRVLSYFKCPLRSVRFLKLTSGSRIREHRDFDLGFESGQLRFHVPICTNREVEFFLDAQRLEMHEGECWYLDLSLPHWVANRGETDRIHLVIDCEVNDWLQSMIPIAEPRHAVSDQESASAPAELECFRQTVLNDLALQQRLRQTADRECFVRLLVATGREQGYRFNAEDAEEALLVAQQMRFETWID
jgi:hypothetical protein